MTKNSMINDLTTGGVVKKLTAFAFPFMLSNALQNIYSMADMFFVGKYVGSHGLSAVTVSTQIIMFMTMFCMGFSTGGQILISQLTGAQDKKGIEKTIGTLFTSVAGLAVLMTVGGLFFKDMFLSALNTPEQALKDAGAYLTICCSGIIFIFGYNMLSAVFRGMGDSKRPFVFIAAASVTNIILDFVFTGLLGFGVAGAAWATVISQAASFTGSIIYLYKKRDAFGFDFKLQSFAISIDKFKILMRIGIPFALQSSAITLSMMFVTSFVNDFGVAASATYGIGNRVDHIPSIMTQAIGFAASAMIGQNLGAGKVERAKHTVYAAIAIAFVTYTIAGILYFFFPEQIFSVFTNDPEVLELSRVFITAALFGFPAMAMMTAFNSFIQGIGNASFSFIIAVLDGVVFRITLSYLFGFVLDMGLFGFFLGNCLPAYATAIPGAIYFFSGVWHKRKLLTGGESVIEAAGKSA